MSSSRDYEISHATSDTSSTVASTTETGWTRTRTTERDLSVTSSDHSSSGTTISEQQEEATSVDVSEYTTSTAASSRRESSVSEQKRKQSVAQPRKASIAEEQPRRGSLFNPLNYLTRRSVQHENIEIPNMTRKSIQTDSIELPELLKPFKKPAPPRRASQQHSSPASDDPEPSTQNQGPANRGRVSIQSDEPMIQPTPETLLEESFESKDEEVSEDRGARRTDRETPTLTETDVQTEPISAPSARPSETALVRHLAIVGECFRKLYSHDQLSDVIVHIDNYTFSAHKALLMAHSDYFYRVLLDTDRHMQTEIYVAGIPSAAFQLILEYMYTSQVELTLDNVADILTAAQQLIMPSLVERCETIVANIDKNPSDALTILDMSTSKESEVFQRAMDVVIRNFTNVIDSSSVHGQQISIILALLSSDELVVNNEMDVFRAGLNWINRDIPDRMSHAEAIFGCIRFCHMTPLQLVECAEMMKKFHVYQGSPEILNAMWFSVCRMYNRDSTFNITVPPRRRYLRPEETTPALQNKSVNTGTGNTPTSNTYRDSSAKLDTSTVESGSLVAPFHLSASHLAEDEGQPADLESETIVEEEEEEVEEVDDTPPDQSLLIVGGRSADPCYNAEEVGKLVLAFTPSTAEWRRVAEMPEPRHLHAVAVMVDCLYVIGGSRPLDQYERYPIPSDTVFKWHLRTHKWSQCASMNHRRIHHGVCVLNHRVYAIAGQNECAKVLTSVEVYNPILDRWKEVAPISIGRIGLGVTSYDGQIMVAGGYHDICTNTSGKHVVGAVEVYDPSANSWTFLSDLPYPRCHAGLANVSGSLFFCAGATRTEYDKQKTPGVASISNVDKYNPGLDRWEKFINLTHRRHGAPVAAIQNKLYIIGGVSSVEQGAVNNVECLDIEEGLSTCLPLKCAADMGMGVVVCNTDLLEASENELERRATIH